jgi:hypothetical protein
LGRALCGRPIFRNSDGAFTIEQSNLEADQSNFAVFRFTCVPVS